MGGLVVAVEDIRVQIGAIRPDDRPDFGVNADLREQVVVPRDLLEYRTPQQRLQINHALGTVRERETEVAEPLGEAVFQESFKRPPLNVASK